MLKSDLFGTHVIIVILLYIGIDNTYLEEKNSVG